MVFTSSILLMVVLPSLSAGAEIGGGVGLGVSHIDNDFLTSPSCEFDETILQTSPYLLIGYESPGLDGPLNRAVFCRRHLDLTTTNRYYRSEAGVTGIAPHYDLGDGDRCPWSSDVKQTRQRIPDVGPQLDRVVVTKSRPLLVTSGSQALVKEVGEFALDVDSGKRDHAGLK